MTQEINSQKDYYKHLSLFWTDLLYLMSSKPQALSSVGPMRTMAANSKKVAAELIEVNERVNNLNMHLSEYYRQLADTWAEAQKKVNLKVPDIPQDPEHFEAYKRVWIDIFDNDFTELFDSKSFGTNYGKMVSQELELAKHWNNITGIILKAANLPNREELDEVYKELHELRRRVSKLEASSRQKTPRDTANDKKTPTQRATGRKVTKQKVQEQKKSPTRRRTKNEKNRA